MNVDHEAPSLAKFVFRSTRSLLKSRSRFGGLRGSLLLDLKRLAVAGRAALESLCLTCTDSYWGPLQTPAEVNGFKSVWFAEQIIQRPSLEPGIPD